MTNPINELELQRCVDGELPVAERRDLLERIDAMDHGWKTLALAFLENQDFDSASAEFRRGEAESRAMLPANRSPIPCRSPVLTVQSLALAASIAAAFWLGVRAGRPVSNDRAMGGRSAESVASAAGGSKPGAAFQGSGGGPRDLEGSRPTAFLRLPFSGAGEDGVAIPVYDRWSLGEEGPEIPLWPDRDRTRSLTPQGYRLTSERNVLSIPLSSGETVLVPVEVSGVRYAVQ